MSRIALPSMLLWAGCQTPGEGQPRDPSHEESSPARASENAERGTPPPEFIALRPPGSEPFIEALRRAPADAEGYARAAIFYADTKVAE